MIAYICPKCKINVSMTQENLRLDNTCYMCSQCKMPLAYPLPHHHGSGKIEIRKTTDYFHGVCPNCKTDKDYGMMVLRGEIIVGESAELRGILILPLKCRRCGYEDAIKIATANNEPIEIEFE